jgi:hypothetical protein
MVRFLWALRNPHRNTAIESCVIVCKPDNRRSPLDDWTTFHPQKFWTNVIIIHTYTQNYKRAFFHISHLQISIKKYIGKMPKKMRAVGMTPVIFT